MAGGAPAAGEADSQPLFENAAGNASPESQKNGVRRRRNLLAPFHFVSGAEICVLIFGSIFALGAGAMMPLFINVFGDLLNELNTTVNMGPYARLMLYLGISMLFLGWAATSSFEYLSDRQASKFKLHFFTAVMRQEQGWFDKNDPGTLASRLDSNSSLIRFGVGIKLATGLQFLTTVVASFVLAFTKSWKMSLVSVSMIPLIVLAAAFLAWSLRATQRRALDAYKQAGSVAEEALANVRTIVSLGGEGYMAQAYTDNLQQAQKTAIKGGFLTGAAMGSMMACVFFMYALGFWYGGGLVADSFREMLAALGGTLPPPGTPFPADLPKQSFQGGDAVMVLIWIMIAAFSMGQIVPSLGSYLAATEAASDLLEVITRTSRIDPFDSSGAKDVKLSGDIVYENVTFAYPARPDKIIFRDLSLTIPNGKTVALVGSSGCGKSTIVQLLQRQYEPLSGDVKIGSRSLQDINIAALRAGLGVVNQEPKLFSTTVKENIALGSKKEVSMEQVEAAAEKANAARFIADFVCKYETDCGAMGSQLSGGQKQRIAIARALVREPDILIFDEATSALDNASERVVQAALDSLIASSGITTIIIAHRLSTVQRADLIIVLGQKPDGSGSCVVQQGTHEELMKDENGLYYSLVQSQVVGAAKDEEEPNEDDDDADEPETATQVVEGGQGMIEHTPARSRRRLSEDSHYESVRSWISSASREGEKPQGRRICCGRRKRPQKKDSSVSGRRIVGLATKYPFAFLLTALAAALNGIVFPCYSVVFSRFVALFFEPDPDKIDRETTTWSLWFVGIGVLAFFSEWFKFVGIEYMGSKVTTELRGKAFTQTMHQDIAFFDDNANSVGTLMSILSADVLVVKTGSCGNPMALVEALSAVLAGCIIAFTSSWKLALVILCCLFVLGPANMMQQRIMHTHGHDEDDKKGGNKKRACTPEQVMNESVSGIRVVSAFGLEQHFIDLYRESLHMSPREEVKRALIPGFFWGFSQFVQFAINGLGMWYGGELIKDGARATDIMQAIFGLMFAGMTIGQTVLYSTGAAKAQTCAQRVFGLIDRPSAIDARDQGGRRFDGEKKAVDVEYNSVNFRYPTRPNIPVYRNLSFKINAGETVALVGQSGCGKSTAIQLLERFYDLKHSVTIGKAITDPPVGSSSTAMGTGLTSAKVAPQEKGTMEGKTPQKQRGERHGGSITFDGTCLRETNVSSLREQMGLVGQEPVLFNMTIAENIRFSYPQATMEEIIEAATRANADAFIKSFPAGFDTVVGRGGGQLSGGQKQRIAIARALVRKPRVLLLDEATSALDAEAERQVQKTLDELVVSGHTHSTVIVAHRLSTVKNA
ncbi:abc transporter transmembrane region domain-containing protein, partial [Cystoisospora suis]